MSYEKMIYELEMMIYGLKTIYGLICFTLILIMFYIFKDKKEEKNKNDLREKSRREKIKNFLKKNFVFSAFTLESIIWFCLLSYAYFTKNIILMYNLRDQLNYFFGRGAVFFILCVWLEDKNFKFLYFLGYIFVNIISSLIFGEALILTLYIKIENSKFILLLLRSLLLSIGYFLLMQATYDSFKEMSYKKYKINEEKDSYKFEGQKKYHENNNLEVIEQFENSKVEDEIKYSHKNNEELEISKEIESKKIFSFKPFILGLIIIAISFIFIKNCTSNKPSYTKDSVIQENGSYIVENNKLILKKVSGEVFLYLNWDNDFPKLVDGLKNGDKGSFYSKEIYHNKFSFSRTLTLYRLNGNKLFEMELNELDFSNFPIEILDTVPKDKDKFLQFISDKDKLVEYFDKGYFSIKNTTFTLFSSFNENQIKFQGTFDNNLEGEIKIYYESGKLQMIGNLKKGLPEGEMKSYYENGNLQRVVQVVNGLEEGEWKEYYENGNLQNISYFSNGKLEGEQRSYFENGNLQNIIYFKNGTPEGKYKEYHENGKLAISTTFKKGIQNGICEIYNRNGKLINKVYLYNWKN